MWGKYKKVKNRRNHDSQAEIVHKVAWAMVKHNYEKEQDGDWYEKKSSQISCWTRFYY